MKSTVIFGAIVLGFVLLVAGGLWTSLFPGTSSWTPEKATRWSEVKSQIYNLSFTINRTQRMHSGSDPGAAMAEYKALQKENDELASDFESAANRPNTVAKTLKWSGIALAAVGIIGWFAVKDS